MQRKRLGAGSTSAKPNRILREACTYGDVPNTTLPAEPASRYAVNCAVCEQARNASKCVSRRNACSSRGPGSVGFRRSRTAAGRRFSATWLESIRLSLWTTRVFRRSLADPSLARCTMEASAKSYAVRERETRSHRPMHTTHTPCRSEVHVPHAAPVFRALCLHVTVCVFECCLVFFSTRLVPKTPWTRPRANHRATLVVPTHLL